MNIVKIAILAISTLLLLFTAASAEDRELLELIEDELTFCPGSTVIQSNQHPGSARIVLDCGESTIHDIIEYYDAQIAKYKWAVQERIVEQGMLILMLKRGAQSGSIVIRDDNGTRGVILSVFKFSGLSI
jgi:hypothetical protein